MVFALDIASEASEIVREVSALDRVSTFLEQLEKHHLDTVAHSKRVATYATKLALATNVDPWLIAEAGLLHDIGKLDVPVAILDSTTGLTAQQRAIINYHPITGYHRLAKQNNLVKAAALGHHQFGRTAYPGAVERGGRETVQIIALADVYDALTSPRTYKPAFSKEKALEIIREDFTGDRALISLL